MTLSRSNRGTAFVDFKVRLGFLMSYADSMRKTCDKESDGAAFLLALELDGIDLKKAAINELNWGWAYPQFLLRGIAVQGLAMFDDWHQGLVWRAETAKGMAPSKAKENKAFQKRNTALRSLDVEAPHADSQCYRKLTAFRKLRHLAAHTASHPGPRPSYGFIEVLDSVLSCDREASAVVPGSGHFELTWDLPKELEEALEAACLGTLGGPEAIDLRG